MRKNAGWSEENERGEGRAIRCVEERMTGWREKRKLERGRQEWWREGDKRGGESE